MVPTGNSTVTTGSARGNTKATLQSQYGNYKPGQHRHSYLVVPTGNSTVTTGSARGNTKATLQSQYGNYKPGQHRHSYLVVPTGNSTVTTGSARGNTKATLQSQYGKLSQGNTDRHSYLVHISLTCNSSVTMDKPGQHRQTIKAALWHNSTCNSIVTIFNLNK